MGSAWDILTENVSSALEQARERRENTTLGERLGFGLSQALSPSEDEPDTAWGRVTRARGMGTPPFLPEKDEHDTAWGRILSMGTQNKDGGDKVDASYIKTGLIKRGLEPHVAEAFVWNMMDESGLRSSINEIDPLVEGSRGGFGLYQATGPRRRSMEAMAEQRGVDVGDTDLQLDHLVWELKNTEKRAARKLAGTTSSQEAASIIVNDFLRPAKEHRMKRTKKYLSGEMAPVENVRIRSWSDLYGR